MFSTLKLTYLFILAVAFTCSLVSAGGCSKTKLELQDSYPLQLDSKQTFKSYIVLFKPGTDLDIVRETEQDVECSGGVITHRYRVGVLGFAAQVPSDAVTTFTTSPYVQIVEEDHEIRSFNDNEKMPL